LDSAEGLIAEDHPEPEGVVRGVALPDRHLVAWVQLLGQRGEVQPAGPAACDSDPHRPLQSAVTQPQYRLYVTCVSISTYRCRPPVDAWPLEGTFPE